MRFTNTSENPIIFVTPHFTIMPAAMIQQYFTIRYLKSRKKYPSRRRQLPTRLHKAGQWSHESVLSFARVSGASKRPLFSVQSNLDPKVLRLFCQRLVARRYQPLTKIPEDSGIEIAYDTAHAAPRLNRPL